MRRGSPFHSRTSALCDSWEWRGWAGYLAASSYSLVPEMEYYAIRHSAGLLDVSPLYKYRISGKDMYRDELIRLAGQMVSIQFAVPPRAQMPLRGFFPMWPGNVQPLRDPVHLSHAAATHRPRRPLGSVQRRSGRPAPGHTPWNALAGG